MLTQPEQHGCSVLGDLHVDEVNDDDSADIPQAELPGDLLESFSYLVQQGSSKGNKVSRRSRRGSKGGGSSVGGSEEEPI